jgi:hypothetical protein
VQPIRYDGRLRRVLQVRLGRTSSSSARVLGIEPLLRLAASASGAGALDGAPLYVFDDKVGRDASTTCLRACRVTWLAESGCCLTRC